MIVESDWAGRSLAGDLDASCIIWRQTDTSEALRWTRRACHLVRCLCYAIGGRRIPLHTCWGNCRQVRMSTYIERISLPLDLFFCIIPGQSDFVAEIRCVGVNVVQVFTHGVRSSSSISNIHVGRDLLELTNLSACSRPLASFTSRRILARSCLRAVVSRYGFSFSLRFLLIESSSQSTLTMWQAAPRLSACLTRGTWSALGQTSFAVCRVSSAHGTYLEGLSS